MEEKLFHVNIQNCIGCRNCELACSFSHLNNGKPTQSRITIIREKPDVPGENMVVVCMQCDDAACVSACPANALWRDPVTGAINHVSERCISCGSCVAACPFGNMHWEASINMPVKCDLCGGDPACVKFCPTNAIEYK